MTIKATHPYTDEELTCLLNKGDREAFNEIYNRYWEYLYRFAVKKVGDKSQAEDLIQDLFVSIWEKRDTLLVNASLRGYLFSALKFKIINFYESSKVKQKHIDSLKTLLASFDHTTGNTIICNDIENHLEIGLNKLSPKVRLVFQLSRYENLSQDEIAKKLDISKQTVKNQMSKALKVLREHLDYKLVWFYCFVFFNG